MEKKTKSGCIIATLVAVGLVVIVLVVTAMLTFRGYRASRDFVTEKMQEARAKQERIAREAAGDPLELNRDELPDYSAYQSGTPLSPATYLAWKVDRGTTSLTRDTFLSRIEGAPVRWQLRTGDLREDGDLISGDFYLPYLLAGGDEAGPETGVQLVRCEFPAAERDSLLDLRRDQTTTISGILSVRSGEVVITQARRAEVAVEEE
jgi:hypothetical protein